MLGKHHCLNIVRANRVKKSPIKIRDWWVRFFVKRKVIEFYLEKAVYESNNGFIKKHTDSYIKMLETQRTFWEIKEFFHSCFLLPDRVAIENSECSGPWFPILLVLHRSCFNSRTYSRTKTNVCFVKLVAYVTLEIQVQYKDSERLKVKTWKIALCKH